jgi:hypothetical protein
MGWRSNYRYPQLCRGSSDIPHNLTKRTGEKKMDKEKELRAAFKAVKQDVHNTKIMTIYFLFAGLATTTLVFVHFM